MYRSALIDLRRRNMAHKGSRKVGSRYNRRFKHGKWYKYTSNGGSRFRTYCSIGFEGTYLGKTPFDRQVFEGSVLSCLSAVLWRLLRGACRSMRIWHRNFKAASEPVFAQLARAREKWLGAGWRCIGHVSKCFLLPVIHSHGKENKALHVGVENPRAF